MEIKIGIVSKLVFVDLHRDINVNQPDIES